MQVAVFTRHYDPECRKKADRFWRRCNCPKWLYWHLDGKMHRESANTRSWEKAERKARNIERRFELIEQGQKPKAAEPMTIGAAIKRYLDDKRIEGHSPETLYKLEVLFRKQLLAWCDEQGLYYLIDLDPSRLGSFRQALASGQTTADQLKKNSPLSLKKKQERLSGLFRFCMRNKWIDENPAAALSPIYPKDPPTDYFPPDEMDRIIDATYLYDQKVSRSVGEMTNNATRLRTLTFLLRWSGLSLGDGATLERSRLNSDNTLLLRRAKTGVPVYLLLPDFVAEALRNVPPGPKPNPAYFFWSGNGERKSYVKDWGRAYRRLFKLADIRKADGVPKRCFPHMFRDTFAVEQLLSGMSLDDVAELLGNSVKVCEKHYAPFVRARQQKIIDNQKKAWANMGLDPVTGKVNRVNFST